MPRSARHVLPGFPHHVVTRGNNRRRLFSNAKDYRRFVGLLGQAAREAACLVHQLTLMTNHVHVGATPATETGLALMMKSACQRYAQYRNKRKDASGKLFEQRYYSEPIETERHLAAVTLYADANAFRAEMVTSPEKHRWSTCGLHAGAGRVEPVIADIWTPNPWYLGLGDDPVERAAAYREALASYVASWGNEQESRKSIDAALGAIESLSVGRYRGRQERPDGSNACDNRAVFVVRQKMTHYG